MEPIHARIKEDRDESVIQSGFKWSDISVFRNYASGKQPIIISEKQKALLKNLDITRFFDNVCGQILLESTGRIQFTGWDCVNEPVNEWLDDFYKTARIEGRQGDFTYRTLRDGNFAVSIGWDNKKEKLRLLKEDWWDGTSGVFFYYGDDGEVEYVVKEWTISDAQKSGLKPKRRNVYFEDRIERYIDPTGTGTGEGWVVFSTESDDGIWPVPWLDKSGEPLGIPFIHFSDNAKTYGEYGVSELDGGVIGFQDQINDAQLSIAITIRLTGGQMYYASGVTTANKVGTTIPEEIGVEAGKVFTTKNDKAKFGVLPAGDIDKQIAGYNLKLKRVSQMSATPLHIITGGDWPSGEALLRAEMPAVHKAWKQIYRMATSYIEIATKALSVYNTFKPSSDPEIDFSVEKGIIEAKFVDPEKRDAISRSIIVHNLAGNVSKKESMRIMGYSEERANEIYDEILEEGDDAIEAMVKATDGGNGVGGKESRGGNSSTNEDAK